MAHVNSNPAASAAKLPVKTSSPAAARVAPEQRLRADHGSSFVDSVHRQAWIAEAAYYRAEQRGFEPGHELEDWLAAEAHVDRELASAASPN